MSAIAKIKALQEILGVTPDGDIGKRTRAAFDALDQAGNAEIISTSPTLAPGGVHRCAVSSFADPADVAAFRRCKATGESDLHCFAHGDNGIGQFGKITAQDEIAMVAVHGTAMVDKWGSIPAAAHKPVLVTVNGKTISATVEDRISAPGRIDLNPAAAKQLGLKPPIDPKTTEAAWEWA